MHLNREGLNTRSTCCDAVRKSISSTEILGKRRYVAEPKTTGGVCLSVCLIPTRRDQPDCPIQPLGYVRLSTILYDKLQAQAIVLSMP